MADIKVSAVAKEYNVTSAVIVKKLKELGEDGFTPSSGINNFVLKQLRKELGEPPKPEVKSEPKAKAETKSKQPKSTVTSGDKSESSAKQSVPLPKPKSPVTSADSSEKIPLPKPIITPEGAASATPVASAIPTPAFAAKAHQNRVDSVGNRSGNNPYAIAGVPRSRNYGANRGGPRGFGGRPGGNQAGGNQAGGGVNRPYQGQNGGYNQQNHTGGTGGFNRNGQGGRPYQAGARPAGGGARGGSSIGSILGGPAPFKPGATPGKPAAKGGFNRPGQKGGAFGKQGSRAKYKKEKTRNLEQDILEMPTIHGITVPKGDGKTVVRLKQGASLTDFGEKIGANPANLVMILFKEFGQMITATQSLDEETLELLAVELGYNIEMVSEDDMDRELLEEFDIDLNAEEEDQSTWESRPPVVTVMGHVDHGKTKLLDAIRNTNVTQQESGGITQKIGAYQIHLEHEGIDRKITFIDTPGHEAFTAMRARGAEITDVAILVVAADDGVMPQTIEAINHAQAANVPIVVAVNKIDKEGASPDKVRGQLTEYGLVAEEYGGETMFVNISAIKGEGITELLDNVLLTVDAAMELKANHNQDARGSVIEARLDKGRGPVVSVLVQAGTIKVGDSIVAGRSYGKVRALTNETGRKLTQAFPSCPVRLLGLQSVPTAGDSFLVAPDDRTARQIAEKREAAHRAALLAKRRKRMSLEDFKDAVEAGKVDRMNLIIKGDTSGSVEALEDELIKIEEDAALKGEVGLNVIHRGVGDVTQNDVNLATVDNAVIIAFNVKTAGMAGDIADAEGIEIKYYSIIYKVIEDIELALHGMLKPEYEESIIGYAEVRQIFKSSKAGTIAGSMVKGGEIKRGVSARVFRNEKEIATDDKIAGLKRFKDDATEVKEGFECGITLANFNDLAEGDIIETYEMVEKPRELPKRSDSGKVSKGKQAKS